MKNTINQFTEAFTILSDYVAKTSETELRKKREPKKWSKKEIIGHLIDSAVNNLQRFTEIQFGPKPFKITTYNQQGLVQANDYQNAITKDLIDLWVSINQRIIQIMKQQTEETLKFEVELENGQITDLQFLMEDYVIHLQHHLNQITTVNHNV